MLRDIIMHQQARIVVGIVVNPVVEARARIEVAHHHPQLLSGVGLRSDRMRADILDLHAPVTVTAVFGLAGVAVHGLKGIRLRPRMERHDIDRPAVLHDPGPARAVRNDAVGSLADDSPHVLDQILRRNDLREIVAVAAHIPIFMTVTGRQFAPVRRQVAIDGIHPLRRTRLIDRLGLAPHAYVGIVAFDPRHEIVVAVALVRPHAVLNIPIEQTHVVRPLAASCGQRRRKKQERRKTIKRGLHRHMVSVYTISICGNTRRHCGTAPAPCCRRYS